MKTKNDAAKILFNAGWNYEEIRSVLDGERIPLNPLPLAPETRPARLPERPWISPSTFWYTGADKLNRKEITDSEGLKLDTGRISGLGEK